MKTKPKFEELNLYAVYAYCPKKGSISRLLNELDRAKEHAMHYRKRGFKTFINKMTFKRNNKKTLPKWLKEL
jgi:hypothetical protein